MAYTPATMSLALQLIGGKCRIWEYLSADPFSTVDDTDYFALVAAPGTDIGIEEGDIVIHVETDTDPPGVTFAVVSAIDSDGNATVAALVMGSAPSVTDLTASGTITAAALTVTGTALIGDAAADLLGFHGSTGATQRAGSNQVSSVAVTSASYGALQVAMIQEIINTLTSVGLWKGAA